MTGVTMTGISLEKATELLTEPFNEKEFGSNKKNRGIEYLPVETLEARLDTVFGRLGYDRIVSDLQTISFGDTETVIVKMTCVFYDNEHNVILTKSAHGGADLQVNSNGNAVSIKSAVASAESDAFKKVCSSLGIGQEQLREKNTFGNGQSGKEMSVVICSPWKKTQNYIKATVSYAGKDVELCIFKDAFDIVEQRLPIEELITGCVPGKTLKIKGAENTYNGKEQIIFKSF